MITKYDRFSRVVYTGWIEQEEFSTQERHALQLLVNGNNTPQYESKLAQPITVNSVSLPYSNDVQPSGGIIILTINYYDDYTFTAAPSTIPSQINGVEILQNVKGMSTGNWTRVLTSPNESLAETSFIYYDKRGRAFYTKVNNHLGGHTETFSELDFQGTPLETQTIHQRDSNPLVVTIIDEFEYLHNGKLKKHIQKVNNNPKELIVANTYDELGQLISKQVGGQDIQNEIGYQKIDYRYNIRGWLTHINDIDDLSDPNAQMGDLFAFKINYNEITEVDNGDMNFVATSFNNTVKPLFNGNIAETYWKSRTDNILRKYSYSYDNLNRLRKAYFQKPYDVVSHTQSFDEYIDYDKNGNIDRLQRFADQNEYGNVIEIDALGYHYEQHSNKLMKVTDATNFSAGFSDDGEDGDDSPDQNDDYAYDDNGNMISDENKGITSIKYNHLNLPTEISFVNGRIHYLYNASGVKVGKTVYQGSEEPVVTDYLGGFQYVKNELQFFPHPEGYVSVVKFGPDNLVINYAYQYKDHLGNIRLNFGKDPETNVLKVLEENHYYPFGLKHQNYNTGRKQYGKKEDEITALQFPGLVLPTEEKPMVYKYKYNGKEWQDELGLNFYDYGARNYDPAIGRWMNIDPLAENSRRWTPYNYAYNNPILFIDPDGMQAVYNWEEHDKGNKGVYTDSGKNVSFDEALNSLELSGDDSKKNGKDGKREKETAADKIRKKELAKKETEEQDNSYNFFYKDDIEERKLRYGAEYINDGGANATTTIAVNAHGIPNSIDTPMGSMDAQKLHNYLYKNNILYRQSYDNKTIITINLNACQTGNGMAKKLSYINPYINVTAPTTNCIGIFNILKDDGKWVTYHKGIEIKD